MHSLTSDENPWGTPSKVYFSDKPLDLNKLSDVELRGAMRGGGKSRIQMELIEQSVDWKELDCNTIEFNAIEPLEKSDNSYKIDDFKGGSVSLKFEVKFPKPHLPRKKKKALKKLVMPYAEHLYEYGIAGRKQQFVTVGWLRIWIKVKRNKLKRK